MAFMIWTNEDNMTNYGVTSDGNFVKMPTVSVPVSSSCNVSSTLLDCLIAKARVYLGCADY